MRVIVVTPDQAPDFGFEHELVVCHDPLDYGRELAKVWREGEGFILVEADVQAKPQTISRLSACRRGWCAWPYDDPNPDEEPVVSLGCMKFGKRLVHGHPSLWKRWEGARWESVEPSVLWAIRQTTGRDYPHLHGGGKYTKRGMRATSPLGHRRA